MKTLDSSPRPRQWQRWKENSRVFLIPLSLRGKKNQDPVLEPESPALFGAGCGSASPSAPALHPPTPPRHSLAQIAGLSL